MNILRKLFGKRQKHDRAASMSQLVVTPSMTMAITHNIDCALVRSFDSDKIESCDCKERGRIYVSPGYYDE